MFVRSEQYLNAPLPIDVTLLCISILVKPEQYWNVFFFISVMSLGITRLVTFSPFKYKSNRVRLLTIPISPKSILHHADRSVIFILLRLVQLSNALYPIDVILLGILSFARLEHS